MKPIPLWPVPCAYRLPFSRYKNAGLSHAAEVVATMFEEARPTQWAIREGGMVLTKKGEWEYEPQPSSRTKAFLARSRWGSAEKAIAFAMKHLNNRPVD